MIPHHSLKSHTTLSAVNTGSFSGRIKAYPFAQQYYLALTNEHVHWFFLRYFLLAASSVYEWAKGKN